MRVAEETREKEGEVKTMDNMQNQMGSRHSTVTGENKPGAQSILSVLFMHVMISNQQSQVLFLCSFEIGCCPVYMLKL